MNKDVDKRSIIFYDGDCGLCNRFILFILKFERENLFFFSALDSELAKNNLQSLNSDTVVLLQNGNEYYRSQAALLIIKEMIFPICLLTYLRVLPLGFRDFFYKIMAKNRKRFFKGKEQCLFPDKEVKKRFL